MGASESRSAGEMLWKSSKLGDQRDVVEILDHPQGHEVIDWKHPSMGTTPLMMAVHYGHLHVVKTLLAHGGNINTRDSAFHGNTSLHYAAYYNRCTILRLLLSKGGDAFVWNNRGHSAIDVCRFRGNGECERILSHACTLHASWVMTKKGSGATSLLWKRRYCQVLKCSPENTLIELAFYREPSSARPTSIILYNPCSEVLLQLSNKSWTDKDFMFGFEHAVVVQSCFANGFSRNNALRLALEKGQKISQHVKFAADSEAARVEWIDVIQTPINTEPNQHVHQSPPIRNSPQTIMQTSNAETINHFELFPRRDSPLFPEVGDSPLLSAIPPHYESLFTTGRSSGGEGAGHDTIASAPPFPDDYASMSPPTPVPNMEILSPASDCVVCMDANRNVVCIPCGHLATCVECLIALQTRKDPCPICRSEIESYVRIYNA